MLLVNITVKTMSSLVSCDMALSGIVVKWECHEVLGWAPSSWNVKNVITDTNTK